MANNFRRKKSSFILSSLFSVLISFGIALLYVIVDTRAFQKSSESPWWLGALLSFALTGWILDRIELWRTYPERDFYKTISTLCSNQPKLKGVIKSRLSRRLDDLSREIGQLTSGDGEIWGLHDRLQTANDLCSGLNKISKYDATSTDAPYLPPSDTREFYEKQANKLPRGKTRRLLVYPIVDLVHELTTAGQLKNLDDYIRLHADNGFELRYWPHSIKELNSRLDRLLGMSKAPRLVDFGIINDDIIFGQSASENDIMHITGRGHIAVSGGEIRHYIEMFDQLWEQTKPECYPSAQLNTLVWICEMRMRMANSNSHVEGKVFFDETVSKITNTESFCAIDIADDIKSWWRKPEYQRFLEASVYKASKSKENRSRVFLLKQGLGTPSDAQLFIRNVVARQVNAGVEVGIASFETLVDKNLGVVDCIFDNSGWGFYLLPGDIFSEENVTNNRNLIDSAVIQDFQQIFRNIREEVERSGWLLRSVSDIKESELVAWLGKRPSRR